MKKVDFVKKYNLSNDYFEKNEYYRIGQSGKYKYFGVLGTCNVCNAEYVARIDQEETKYCSRACFYKARKKEKVTGAIRQCSKPGCNRKHEARGFCKKHYSSMREKGNFKNIASYQTGTKDGKCSISGCDKQHESQGLCRTHLRHKRKVQAVMVMGGSCSVCGYDKCVENLVFHHVNPADKTGKIQNLMMGKPEKLYAELEKCTLLCANCHAKMHTYTDIQNVKENPRKYDCVVKGCKNKRNSKKYCATHAKHERKVKAVKYKGNHCIVCGYHACLKGLHFHHVGDDKDYPIGMSSKSWEKIQIELDKCELVCANCHGEIHNGHLNFSEWYELRNSLEAA